MCIVRTTSAPSAFARFARSVLSPKSSFSCAAKLPAVARVVPRQLMYMPPACATCSFGASNRSLTSVCVYRVWAFDAGWTGIALRARVVMSKACEVVLRRCASAAEPVRPVAPTRVTGVGVDMLGDAVIWIRVDGAQL